MSMLSCERCDALIDTDNKPEAYVEKINMWLCEICRDDIAEQNMPLFGESGDDS